VKKIKVICLITIFILLTGVMIFLSNYNSSKLVNVEDIKTDDNYENITYDKTEDVWDDSVLGIITIEKIGLNATVKEGTTSDILLEYVGHIENTATYDGNIGLAGHNRGCKNSYFARLNELKIGDEIRYKTKFYERTYVVDNIQVILETDWGLLQSTEENKLSLITCITNKRKQRLCVQATEKTCNIMDTELQ
jgi:LPXTG-site transpeptidase (sortase) family protein